MSGGHHHHHNHHGQHGAGVRVYALPLVLTLAYAALELAGGLWTGSLALAGDAGHMFSDALALCLAAFAAWLSRRPAGRRHTYGWSRAEVIGALINGMLMLGVVILIVVEAVQRLLQPRPVMGGAVIAIALLGLCINALVAWLLSRGDDSLNTRAALLHVMGDLVSSIAAVIAGVVVYFTGWSLIDPLLSMLIAVLISLSTVRLLREALHVLMEGVPASFDVEGIGRGLAGVPGVTSVHDLHVWSLGTHNVALSAHVEIERLEDWPGILRRAQSLLHDDFGIDHATLQPERAVDRRPTVPVTLWPRGVRPS